MSRIEKKTWPEAFELIRTGQKTYDLRLADWHAQPGDTMVFREWNPETGEYTGRSLEKRVGYVGKTKDWEVWPKEEIEKHGFQVISLLDE